MVYGNDDMAESNSGALAEFNEFVKDFRGLLAGFLGAPIVGMVTNYSPPSASRVYISTIIVMGELLALVFAYEVWQHKVIRFTQWIMVISGLCSVCFFFAYIGFWTCSVVSFPDDAKNPVVTGSEITPKVEALRASNPSLYTDAKLLDMFERKPERIWTSDSLKNARCRLTASWILCWILFYVFVAAFVAIQSRRLKFKKSRK